MPSKLPTVYWGNTRRDLKTKLQIRIGFETAVLSQHFESFVETVSMALGGKKSKSAPTGQAIQNETEAIAKFSKVFG